MPTGSNLPLGYPVVLAVVRAVLSYLHSLPGPGFVGIKVGPAVHHPLHGHDPAAGLHRCRGSLLHLKPHLQERQKQMLFPGLDVITSAITINLPVHMILFPPLGSLNNTSTCLKKLKKLTNRFKGLLDILLI